MIGKGIYQTIISAIDDMVIALNLNCYPTIKYENDMPYIMAAGGSLYIRGNGHCPVITKTKSDYILHIDVDKLKDTLKGYKRIFHSAKIVHDAVYLLVCHELRHMWQYQEGYLVGSVYNTEYNDTISELYGHGAKKVEQDANAWMIGVGKSRGIEAMAIYITMEQLSNGLLNELSTTYNDKLIEVCLSTVKQYNVIQYLIYKKKNKLGKVV